MLRHAVRPWEPHELGAFLDHVQAHRLGALFEVLAACGLRRGEALGLAWKDIDFLDRTLTIRRQLLNAWADGAPVFGEPKTATGRRVVEVDSRTLGTLIAHRLAQDSERATWGCGYEDHDLVFPRRTGAHWTRHMSPSCSAVWLPRQGSEGCGCMTSAMGPPR